VGRFREALFGPLTAAKTRFPYMAWHGRNTSAGRSCEGTLQGQVRERSTRVLFPANHRWYRPSIALHTTARQNFQCAGPVRRTWWELLGAAILVNAAVLSRV
jgi:hypothetical protein